MDQSQSVPVLHTIVTATAAEAQLHPQTAAAHTGSMDTSEPTIGRSSVIVPSNAKLAL